MEVERLRLAKPERVGPIRNLAALAGRPDVAAPAAPIRPPDPGAEAEADAARGPAQGANLGYRVIEDYLRQGRDTAERLGLALAGGAGAASFQGLSERLLRDGLLWFEYVAKFWAALDPPRGRANAATAPVAPARGLRVRVASRAPVGVALEVRALATGRALGVHELRCPDPSAAPLAGVELAADAGVEGWCVSLRVADGQPAGHYTGVVFDRDDGSVLGTLSVRVDAEAGR
jgi:hypothetical protein